MEDLDEAQLTQEIEEIMKKVDRVVQDLEQHGFGEKKEEKSDN